MASSPSRPNFRTRRFNPFAQEQSADLATGYRRVSSRLGKPDIQAALKTYGIKKGQLKGKSDSQLMDIAARKVTKPIFKSKPKPKPPKRGKKKK